jgi:hypothetical protein
MNFYSVNFLFKDDTLFELKEQKRKRKTMEGSFVWLKPKGTFLSSIHILSFSPLELIFSSW